MITDFKDEGYNLNLIAEMNIITIVNKLDMSYGFYIKHNMQAVGWKLKAKVDKNKNLFNRLDRSRCHPLIRDFSHVPFKNY